MGPHRRNSGASRFQGVFPQSSPVPAQPMAYALCWTGTDRPGMLFDRATSWLITNKVLLPGATVLERHIARIRSRVQERLWSSLIRGVSPASKRELDALLAVPNGGHQPLLDRLRKGRFRRSASELVRALQRLEEVRRLGIHVGVFHRIPPDASRPSRDSPLRPKQTRFNDCRKNDVWRRS